MEGATTVVLLEVIFVETLIILVMVIVFVGLKKQRKRMQEYAARISSQYGSRDTPEAAQKKDDSQLRHNLATIKNILQEKDNRILLLTDRLTRLGAAGVQSGADRMVAINTDKSHCLDSIEAIVEQDDRMESALKQTVRRLRSEVKSSEDQVALMQSRLATRNRTLRRKHLAGDRSGSPKPETVDEQVGEADDLSQSLEQRRQQLRHEVGRLHDNNRQQRELIADLYRDVKQLKLELSSASDLSKSKLEQGTQRIEELERLIYEFENAVPVLESEVDRLYNQILSFNTTGNPFESTATGGIEEQGNTEKADESPQEQVSARTLFNFLQLCIPIAKEQELLAVLDDTIRQLSVIPALELRLPGDSIRLIPEQYFSVADVTTFDALAPNTRPGFYSGPNLFLFSTARIFIMLTELEQQADRSDEVLNLVRELCQIADLVAERLQLKSMAEQSKNELDNLLSLARNEFTNTEMVLRYQQDDMQRVLNEFIGEITGLLNASDLPPTIDAVLKNTMVEYQAQWNLICFADGVLSDSFKQKLDGIHDRVSRLSIIDDDSVHQ